MKILSVITGLTLAVLLFSQATFADQVFGTGADMTSHVDIPVILDNPDDYLEKDVTIKGKIVKVCKKRGCWVELAAGEKYKTLRVKVRDGEMVFPLSAMGKDAYATGQLEKQVMSVEEARKMFAHRAKEHKETFDPASITEPVVTYQLKPHGVTIIE